MSYHPAPPDEIKDLPVAEIGIEQTRGAPRPWIFYREEARRRRRREHLSRIRRFLAKVSPSHTAR